MYFNRRYDRVGPLFQGRYKAVMVNGDSQLLHLSRYLHLNPSEITDDLTAWYSSYSDYIGLTNTKWLKPDIVLNFFRAHAYPGFKKINSYRDFIENYDKNSAKVLGKLALD